MPLLAHGSLRLTWSNHRPDAYCSRHIGASVAGYARSIWTNWPQHVSHRFQQLRFSKWFPQHRSITFQALADGLFLECGNDDNRNICCSRLGLHCAHKSRCIYERHHEIRNHKLNLLVLEDIQRLQPIASDKYAITHVAEDGLEPVSDGPFVVDHQN